MKIFGQHEPATLIQLADVRSRAVDAALIADGRVGLDMACGNAAIRTDRTLADLGPPPNVLAAQAGTIDILHTFTPLVVVMAGADEFDPYKD